jgi:hypothetical protein
MLVNDYRYLVINASKNITFSIENMGILPGYWEIRIAVGSNCQIITIIQSVNG